LEAAFEQGQERESRVVEIAEPARAVRSPVMRPSRGVIGDPSLEGEFGGANGSADAGGGALEDAGKERIFHRPDAVAAPDLRIDLAGLRGVAQRAHVLRVVEPRELLFARARAAAEIAVAQPVQRPAQIQGRLDTRYGERVVAPVGGLPIDVVADEYGRQPFPPHACAPRQQGSTRPNRRALSTGCDAVVFNFSNIMNSRSAALRRTGRCAPGRMASTLTRKVTQMADMVLDAKGMNCPLPILKTKKALQGIQTGGLLEVLATDPGSVADFKVFCRQTGNELVESTQEGNVYKFVIKRLK